MRSTMQETPLSISTLLEFGATFSSTSTVETFTGEGFRTATFAEVAARAAQLAHALRDDLGVTGDQRVATFMWNNQEHLEAYLAVPSMGAVLHTLNIRLFPDQIIYIANHAEDKVVLVDGTLIPLLAARAAAHSHGRARRRGRRRRHRAAGGRRQADPPLRGPAGRQADDLSVAGDRRDRRRGDVLHLRHHRATPRASSTATAPSTCTRCRSCRRSRSATPTEQDPRDRADVPRDGLGPAVRGVHLRRVAGDARPVPAGGAAGEGDRAVRGGLRRARCRRSGPTC